MPARKCIYMHLPNDWTLNSVFILQIEWQIILIFWLFNNDLCGCGCVRDCWREF